MSMEAKIIVLNEQSIDPRMGRTEREFLPAALEILETAPSPLGRATAMVICGFIVLVLCWTAFSKVDIVAVATGKIVSHSSTQIVQVAEASIVNAIKVENGSVVKAGQPLLTFDRSVIDAEIEHARLELSQAQLDIARLSAFIKGVEGDPFVGLEKIDAPLRQRARLQLDAQIRERQAKLNANAREIEQRQADLEVTREQLNKANAIFPLMVQKADIRQKVSEMQFGNRILGLEAHQQMIESEAEKRIYERKVEADTATLQTLSEQRKQISVELERVAYSEMDRATTTINSAQEALSKAMRRAELATLRSPVDGTVSQLSVKTIGGVVAPGQQILVIVPDNEPLEVQAVIPNREAGFIVVGQEAAIKLDAYPFSRYGLLKGTVINISRDSEITPNGPERAQTGTQASADDSSVLEGSERLVYKVRIALTSTQLNVDGHLASIIPGMSVRAEVKTGKRTILDYVFSPLTEYANNSFHER